MNKTLGEIIINAKFMNDQKQVVGILCGLNSDLKIKHFKGLCTNGINVNTKININDNSFVDMRNMSSNQDIKNDIDNLSLFAISSFVFLNSNANQFVQLNEDVVRENIDFVRGMIPSLMPGDKYYTDIIEGKVFTYYEDYINALEDQASYGNSNGIGNNLAKSYSTAAGRAFSDKSNYDSAFINVMFYPIIIIAILIFCFVVYVTISALK